MIPREVLQKVRQIEIRTKGLVNELFGGEYHSAFKGRGMMFSEVREYHPGDDIRLIDWNVTARAGHPFVKVFEEERELTVYLMVDVSRSGHFGSLEKFKTEIGAEIAAVLGFSAIKNNDKVGVILFSDEVEKYIIPKKGRSHILRVVREVLYHRPSGTGTSLATALEFLLRVAKRRAVVFLISDFIDDNYLQSLRVVNRKHDLIGIQLHDPAEKDFPDIGLAKVHDPETNEQFWIDSSGFRDRQLYREHQAAYHQWLKKSADQMNFDLLQISSSGDYVEPIMAYFKQRERRI